VVARRQAVDVGDDRQGGSSASSAATVPPTVTRTDALDSE
jgi:hypothetical protein